MRRRRREYMCKCDACQQVNIRAGAAFTPTTWHPLADTWPREKTTRRKEFFACTGFCVWCAAAAHGFNPPDRTINSRRISLVMAQDAHFCLLDFDENKSLFGVFDGHGGAEVARLAVEVLPEMIRNQPFNVGDFENALKNAYLDFDQYLRSKAALNRMKILARLDNPANVENVNVDDKKGNKASNGDEDMNKMYGFYSGCTAVVALLVDKKKLYVANIGDSRCVVAVHGTKAVDMSKDHKPRDEPELLRIRAAGARVTYDGRINRDLNLSRAFGDHMYKQNNMLLETEQVVIALPDVQARILNAEYGDYIVLGCDGIWDSLSSQCTVDLISKHIHEPGVKLSSICEKLLSKCFSAERRSKGVDNMTCIIVKFKPKQKQQSDQKDGDHITHKLKKLELH